MSDEFAMGSTQEEVFDFSGDGITKGNYELTITDTEVVEKDNGSLLNITFEAPNLNFPITKGYWLTHSNDRAAAAGRGQLKRIYSAALGQPKGAPSALKGRKVQAVVGENAEGFATISGFKPVAQEVASVTL